MNRLAAIALLFPLIAAGCKRNPVERLTNPYPDGAVPESSGIYTLYDDELKTGGGVAFIPGGENQSIDFQDRSSPRVSANQIRYSWSGGDVFSDELAPPAFQHLFAGFNLIVPVAREELVTSNPKNLSGNGYSRLRMRVRGNLSEGNLLRIEGPDDGAGGNVADRKELVSSEITSEWQEVVLPVSTVNFGAVRIYLTVSIQYSQPPRTTQAGEGGTVYFDDIRFE